MCLSRRSMPVFSDFRLKVKTPEALLSAARVRLPLAASPVPLILIADGLPTAKNVTVPVGEKTIDFAAAKPVREKRQTSAPAQNDFVKNFICTPSTGLFNLLIVLSTISNPFQYSIANVA